MRVLPLQQHDLRAGRHVDPRLDNITRRQIQKHNHHGCNRRSQCEPEGKHPAPPQGVCEAREGRRRRKPRRPGGPIAGNHHGAGEPLRIWQHLTVARPAVRRRRGQGLVRVIGIERRHGEDLRRLANNGRGCGAACSTNSLAIRRSSAHSSKSASGIISQPAKSWKIAWAAALFWPQA